MWSQKTSSPPWYICTSTGGNGSVYENAIKIVLVCRGSDWSRNIELVKCCQKTHQKHSGHDIVTAHEKRRDVRAVSGRRRDVILQHADSVSVRLRAGSRASSVPLGVHPLEQLQRRRRLARPAVHMAEGAEVNQRCSRSALRSRNLSAVRFKKRSEIRKLVIRKRCA